MHTSIDCKPLKYCTLRFLRLIKTTFLIRINELAEQSHVHLIIDNFDVWAFTIFFPFHFVRIQNGIAKFLPIHSKAYAVINDVDFKDKRELNIYIVIEWKAEKM